MKHRQRRIFPISEDKPTFSIEGTRYYFVYGTLRKGQSNSERFLPPGHFEFVSPAKTKGKLYKFHQSTKSVPFVNLEDSDIVIGEVWKVEPHPQLCDIGTTNRKTDQGENWSILHECEKDVDNLEGAYYKRIVPVRLEDDTEINAMIYHINRSGIPIPSGDYLDQEKPTWEKIDDLYNMVDENIGTVMGSEYADIVIGIASKLIESGHHHMVDFVERHTNCSGLEDHEIIVCKECRAIRGAKHRDDCRFGRKKHG